MIKDGPVYINGEVVPPERAVVPVSDRGLNYGDGLFETVKAVGGRPAFMARHVERLLSGAEFLGIGGLDGLVKDLDDGVVERLLAEGGLTDGEAYVKITVTRGSGGPPGHAPGGSEPTTIIVTRRLDSRWIEGVKADGVDAVFVNGPLPSIPRVKTLNYLPNVLAKAKAAREGAFEGIFTRGGVVLEGSSTNVFAVREGRLITPKWDRPGAAGTLPGITRRVVLELAPTLGAEASEGELTTEELTRSDEAFLTNSVLEAVPLLKAGGSILGGGTPGELTRKVQALVRRAVERSVVP